MDFLYILFHFDLGISDSYDVAEQDIPAKEEKLNRYTQMLLFLIKGRRKKINVVSFSHYGYVFLIF